MSKHIVAFDVETTGLSFKDDYIIQLSAIKFDENFNTIATIDHLIKPIYDFEIAEGAFEKHGISKEMIAENGVDLIDAAKEFLAFIEGCAAAGSHVKDASGCPFQRLLLKCRHVFEFSEQSVHRDFVIFE